MFKLLTTYFKATLIISLVFIGSFNSLAQSLKLDWAVGIKDSLSTGIKTKNSIN